MMLSPEYVVSELNKTVVSFDLLRKELRKSCNNKVIICLEDFGDNLKIMLEIMAGQQEILRLLCEELKRIDEKSQN